jgi:hypothetical protein
MMLAVTGSTRCGVAFDSIRGFGALMPETGYFSPGEGAMGM